MKTKMNWIYGMAVIFLASIIMYACQPKAVDITEDIKKANENFMEAYNSGDAQALAACYTEEGKLLPPNSDIIEGREKIAEYWQAGMDMGPAKLVLETKWAKSFGEVANEEGEYKVYSPDGDLISFGKYIVIWKLIEGKWMLCIDIWNSSKPMPPLEEVVEETEFVEE